MPDGAQRAWRPEPAKAAFVPLPADDRAIAGGKEFARRLTALGTDYRRRTAMLHERGAARWRAALDELVTGTRLRVPLASDFRSYARDFVRRCILTLDVLRRRGNEFREYEATGQPPLLAFDYEILIDGRELPDPVNYCLVRILPPAGVEIEPTKRPYLIIDPRAGHGAGIGGFKQESQVGIALREGNPVYFTVFYPTPEPGQTLACVAAAQRRFMREVARRHPDSPKPALVGNCQGGWAAMALAAVDPDIAGPLVLNGAPLSYWAGVNGKNPMRYLGGLAGGSWLAYLVSDLGNGRFDGAWLVQNFETLNPANTWWTKYYRLFANIDTEAERFLDFEKWWGGFVQLTGDEMRAIVDDLFVGNKLATGGIPIGTGATLDLRRVRSPIVVFCSQGDDITPPQQALNWIADTYLSAREIKAHGQTIVYIVHAETGHLGIFVSGSVVRREFSQIAGTLASIEALPPGLYELVIEDAQPDARGLPQYEVSLHERDIADILAHDDSREDERLFRIVAAVSELNGRAYDLFVAPWVRMMSNDWSAKLLRELHPMRTQRLLWSDANPLLWWLPTAAAFVQKEIPPAAPDNPLLWLQERVSDLVGGFLDSYRDLRDAGLENSFQFVYGALDASGASERLQAGRPMMRSGAEELSARALAGISEGGVPEAVVRMLLLMMKAGGSVRRETLGYVQGKLAEVAAFAALDAATLRTMLTAQNIIVAYEPEQALRTLAALLPTPEARSEAMQILRRVLPADVSARPMQSAMLARFAEVLGEGVSAA
jgi:pimeloyl-ACP methyl ester carboxylesterase